MTTREATQAPTPGEPWQSDPEQASERCRSARLPAPAGRAQRPALFQTQSREAVSGRRPQAHPRSWGVLLQVLAETSKQPRPMDTELRSGTGPHVLRVCPENTGRLGFGLRPPTGTSVPIPDGAGRPPSPSSPPGRRPRPVPFGQICRPRPGQPDGQLLEVRGRPRWSGTRPMPVNVAEGWREVKGTEHLRAAFQGAHLRLETRRRSLPRVVALLTSQVPSGSGLDGVGPRATFPRQLWEVCGGRSASLSVPAPCSSFCPPGPGKAASSFRERAARLLTPSKPCSGHAITLSGKTGSGGRASGAGPAFSHAPGRLLQKCTPRRSHARGNAGARRHAAACVSEARTHAQPPHTRRRMHVHTPPG